MTRMKKNRREPSRNARTDARPVHLDVEGTVAGVFAGGHFDVVLDAGPMVKATVSGRLRRYRIRVLLGDRVRVSLSPYDLTHGLITYRELNRSRRAA